MNISRQLIIRLACVLTLSVATLVAILQYRAIAATAAEQRDLRMDSDETERLTAENAQLEKLRATNQEVRELRQKERELLRLRNQVGQLRAQAAEAAKLRVENRRLASQTNGPHAQPAAAPVDFIPRAALSDVGLGSPEAAVQTFLYALSQGDVKRVAECLGWPDMPKTPEQDEIQSRAYRNQAASFSGFRIADEQATSADEVAIGVQGSAGGAIWTVLLVRNGNEWNVKQ